MTDSGFLRTIGSGAAAWVAHPVAGRFPRRRERRVSDRPDRVRRHCGMLDREASRHPIANGRHASVGELR